MALATIQDTLFDRFKDQLALSAYSALPVSYPNLKFTPPSNSEWLRVQLEPADSHTASLSAGMQRFRSVGLLVIGVFIPVGESNADALAIADAIAAFYRGATLSGLSLQAPSISRVGSAQGFYQYNVIVPYRYDDLVTV